MNSFLDPYPLRKREDVPPGTTSFYGPSTTRLLPCAMCGSDDVFSANNGGLCEVCWVKELGSGLPRDAPGELDVIRVALKIRPGVPWYWDYDVYDPTTPGRAGYRVQTLAVAPDAGPELSRNRERIRLTVMDDVSQDELPVIVRWLVWHPERNGFLEGTWRPARGWGWEIRGLPSEATEDEFKRLRSLLRDTKQRGPRAGDHKALANLKPHEFVSGYSRLRRELDGEAPTQWDMAAAYSVSRTTIWRYCQDNDIPWPPVD